MCELSAPTDSASTGWPCQTRGIFNRELKTCATVSKLTRHQCSSTHDLPSLFVHSRSNRRRVSGCSRFGRIDETRLGASREAVSALSPRRDCGAHHLPRLDLVVGRHHSDG